MANELVQVIGENEARVNITYGGMTGDMIDPVYYNTPDVDIRVMVTEAVRSGTVPGINPVRDADFSDFVVDRFQANEVRPYHIIQIRPKTPFGL